MKNIYKKEIKETILTWNRETAEEEEGLKKKIVCGYCEDPESEKKDWTTQLHLAKTTRVIKILKFVLLSIKIYYVFLFTISITL